MTEMEEISNVVPMAVVIGNEAKCGSGMSSDQDLSKPECNGTNHNNQVNDLDNSYVFVSGADGLPDDDDADDDVVAEGLNVSLEPNAVAVEDQGAESNPRNEKLDVESGKIKNVDHPVVSESSIENGKGIRVSVADSFQEGTGKTESLTESVVEDTDRDTESFTEAVVEKAGDGNGKSKGADDGEQEEFDKLTSSDSATCFVEENHESRIGGSEWDGESSKNSLHISISGNVNCEIGDRNGNTEGAEDDKQEKFDEFKKSDSASGFAENHESRIGVSDLATGSGDNGESNNISLHINSFVNANGEIGDQNTEGAEYGEEEKFDELKKSDSSIGFVQNHDSPFGGSDLVAGSGKNGESSSNSSRINSFGDVAVGGEEKQETLIGVSDLAVGSSESRESNSSGNANGEYANQFILSAYETSEACRGSQDVVVGVVECELQDVSVDAAEDEVKLAKDVSMDAAEDEVKLAKEVMETHGTSGSTFLDVELELNATNSKDERDVVEDVVIRDVPVKAVAEVKSSGEMLADHETPTSTSLDLNLESNLLNTKEETEVVDDIECESQDLSVKAEDGVKLLGEVVVDTESYPTNTNDVLVEDVDCESQDVSVNAEDELELSGKPVDIAEHATVPSTSPDVHLKLSPVNSKDESYVVEDVVECDSKDVSVMAVDEMKLSRGVVETAKYELPLSTSVDLGMESYPINTTEERDVLVEFIKCELQDANMKAKDEVTLSNGVVKTGEHEVPLSISVDWGTRSYPVNTKEDTAVVLEVVECDLQDVNLKTKDEVKLMDGVTKSGEHEDSPCTSLDLNQVNTKTQIYKVEDVAEYELIDVSVRPEDEVILSGEVVETSEHKIPPSTFLDKDTESNQIYSKEGTDMIDDVECGQQDVSVKAEDEVKSSTEEVQTAEYEVTTSISLDLESYPVNTKEETDVIVQVVESELQDVSMKAKGKDDVKLLDEAIRTAEHEVALSNSLDLDMESNPVNNKEEIYMVAHVVECELQDASMKAEDEVTLSGSTAGIAEHEIHLLSSHVTLEPEVHVHNSSAITSGENSGDLTFTSRIDVSDRFNVNNEGAANIELEIEDVENMADQIDSAAGSSNENGNSQDNSTPVVPPGGSIMNVVDGEKSSIKTRKIPFNFLVRVPRFDDDSLREQIRLAKLNIDEKTKLRDAIQVQIQEKRASTQIHGIDYEYAKGEGRNARKLVRSKRLEIDSLQSLINKAKNALSIKDIDSQMYNLEHMIQHETLPLKEEKQIIREIKQLKQLREQLSYNMGSQDEIKQALEQRGEVEERLKVLRKELDILKDKVLKAEASAVEAEKKYDDENKKVKELQAHFRAAADIRQAAYFQWQSLRKELSKKRQHYFKYKDDAAVASNLVFSRDTEELYRLCINNVENFMELWNTNNEFRNDYVKFNARSTVRRFGTLDGRPLGPGEEPHIFISSYVDERVNRIISTPAKVDLESQFPTPEPKEERIVGSVSSVDKSMKKAAEEKYQRAANKGSSRSMQVNDLDTVCDLDITYEEPRKLREEIEVIKKAEETKREDDEAGLKEQRRLEALAKATEARERKKRQAEKLLMRAELKTQKEAEQKEKEREKRLRKKERKKAAATDANDINNSCEIGPSSKSGVETSKELEVKDVSSSITTAKRPKKHWLFGKQGKTKTIPPPLRNRNRKKLQQWIWVGVTCTVILVLFWLGNIGVFSNVNFKRRSPGFDRLV
ncbi:hypothetical protein OROGR_022395 [Orobanche gracilis]